MISSVVLFDIPSFPPFSVPLSRRTPIRLQAFCASRGVARLRTRSNRTPASADRIPGPACIL